MTSYVVGFMFSPNKKNVVLVRKNRPEWQAGKLNGVGGKIEDQDLVEASEWNKSVAALVWRPSDAAIVREFQEETGVKTDINEWQMFAKLFSKEWSVYMYKSFSDKYLQAAQQESEEIEVIPAEDAHVHRMLPSAEYLLKIALLEVDFLNIEYTNTDKP